MSLCDTIVFLDFPTEVCLDGIMSRSGKARPDMPWIETGNEPDTEFIESVRNYNSVNRPVVLERIKKFPGKNVLIFGSRKESDAFLESLKRNSFKDKNPARLFGKKVKVTVDRPLGSFHPEHKDLFYPINYEALAVLKAQGEDAYIIGVDKPLSTFEGKVIAVIHRNDDVEEKWVVAPEGVSFTKEEIEAAVHFQERYFDTSVIMPVSTDGDTVIHPIPPVYDKNSKILILGSFPSVKSRETGFFYGHRQNRFWRVIAGIYGEETPGTIEAKKEMLLRHGIALWDVIKSCEISGSADSSIKNAVPNDIDRIIKSSRITAVFTNGRKADALYKKYLESKTGITAVCLPSTSPANASKSAESLIEEWKKIRNA